MLIVGTSVTIPLRPEYVIHRGLRWREVKERDYLDDADINASSILTL